MPSEKEICKGIIHGIMNPLQAINKISSFDARTHAEVMMDFVLEEIGMDYLVDFVESRSGSILSNIGKAIYYFLCTDSLPVLCRSMDHESSILVDARKTICFYITRDDLCQFGVMSGTDNFDRFYFLLNRDSGNFYFWDRKYFGNSRSYVVIENCSENIGLLSHNMHQEITLIPKKRMCNPGIFESVDNPKVFRSCEVDNLVPPNLSRVTWPSKDYAINNKERNDSHDRFENQKNNF